MRAQLSDEIADSICSLIMDGTFKLEEQIPNETRLAEILNASRGTIREAIKTLVSRNVLEIRRGKGTFVCAEPGLTSDPFGFQFLEQELLTTDIYDARRLMEPEVAAVAAGRAEDEEIALMGEFVQQFLRLDRQIASREITAEKYAEAFQKTELDFHQTLYKMTHNLILERLSTIMFRALNKMFKERAFLDFLNQHYEDTHQYIHQAIAERNPESARMWVKRHLSWYDNIAAKAD